MIMKQLVIIERGNQMFRLFKNLERKDLLIVLIIATLVVFSVFLDLRIPEYMSEITRLVQTEESTMHSILTAGGHMILCAVISLVCTITVGYFSSLLAAKFSRTMRRKIFEKVESFGYKCVKN